MLKNVIKIWKNKGQILEGITNSIFLREDVEEIAKERNVICKSNICNSYDITGEGCVIPGSQPCCDQRNGGCGCSLKFAQRSLSKECPKGFWDIVLTPEEEEKLKEKISY